MSAAESFAATGPGDVRGRGVGAERARARPTRPRARPPARSSAPSPQGDRDDAQARHRRRGPGRPTAWAALTAFDRAARMHAVGDAIEAPPRRARPHAHARPGQAAGAPRPTTRSTSSSTTGGWPPRTPSAWTASCPTRSRPASGSCSCAGRCGVVGRHHARGTGPTRCPPSWSRPRWPAATRSSGRPRRSTAVCAVALAELHRRGRPPARRLQPRHRPRAGRRRRDRRQPRHRTRSAFIGSTRDGAARRPARRRARRCCSRWAATARSSSWTTPTSTPRSRRRSPRASCAPGRAARRASASSCTEARARRVRREARAARDRAGRCSATRSTTPRRWARSTTSGVAAKMDEHVGRRGRPRRVGGGGRRARRRLPDRPLLAGDDPRRRPGRRRASPPRRRSARSRRSWRSARSRRRSS